MSARFGWLLAAMLLTTGCGSKATQVVVTIDAEPGVRMDSARVHVVVLGGVGRTTAPTASRFDRVLTPGVGGDPAYPLKLVLAPLDGDVGRSYSVTATAETATSTFVGQARIIGGYVEGETLTVRLLLEDACRRVTCGDEQTCKAGVCVDARTVANVDAGEPADIGTDLGADLGSSGDGGVALPTYIKASNTGASDYFGCSVSLSADGMRLAVGALGEVSSATGVGGSQADNSGADNGAVYIFSWTGTTWTQEAYLKASNTDVSDYFGRWVSLSADGTRLAVGAPNEDSNARGVGGDQADNSASNSGAVYVFSRTDATWTQEAYVKASNTEANDAFGQSLSLSSDGTRLAVTAYYEDSSATGVGGNQADNSAADSGAVYVFARTGATWTQEAYVKASNTGANDAFGQSASLSSDGARLAVGALGEGSSATGVGSNQADNGAVNSGAVYVFSRTGTTWTQEAYVKASNTEAGDYFGTSASLSADGTRLAVGAYGEDSNATGVGGDQADNTASGSSAVYVLSRTGTTWTQEAYVKASNTQATDIFGYSVSLSADGMRLAVRAQGEDSSATGVGGNQADNAAVDSGAVYRFSRTGTTWTQSAYIKALNTGPGDAFGLPVSLSSDGARLAVGAQNEASSATGIDGNEADNTATDSGAVYVY